MFSNNCYQIAYEQAANEIAEIEAQIKRLTRRKALLEKVLEPLKPLIPEPDVAASVAFSRGANTELSVPEAATEASPVLLMEVPEAEPDSFEDPDAMLPQELEEEADETAVHATNGRRLSGRRLSDEDVAGLAYRFWNEGGQLHGHHEDDWFRATQELLNSA
jgi:hypothetical protein